MSAKQTYECVAGFTTVIGISAGQLDITVGAPAEFINKTKGLLGVFNKDPSDDMLPADGGPALTGTPTEREIYTKFGQTCTYKIPRGH